jgi:hypothetical protein
LGKRRSGSRRAVEGCLGTLKRKLPVDARVCLESDRKQAYRASVRRVLGCGVEHTGFSSKARRDYGNPLFPINHTLAMLRDGVSRLVRRTWAASKRAARLELQLWIWACWRNYVRPITNDTPGVTAAMAAGVMHRPIGKDELLGWRVAPSAAGLLQREGPDSSAGREARRADPRAAGYGEAGNPTSCRPASPPAPS